MSIANRPVLVLNRGFTPINIVTLEQAMRKLTSHDGHGKRDGTAKAEVIDKLCDYVPKTWEEWQELTPNPNYCPECHTIQDASLIKDGHCTVCNHEVGEKGIKGTDTTYRIPKVIRVTKYDKLSSQKIKYNRRTIFRRDENTCQYCGRKPGTKELSMDHVIPRCQGGKTTWENIVVACTPCNSKKAGRTPKEAGMALLKQPKKPVSNLLTGNIRIKDWESWLGAAYWEVELENENP